MTAMENITPMRTKHNYKGFIDSVVLCFFSVIGVSALNTQM